MNYTKVKDNPNLLRDNTSQAIINTDDDAYNAYMERKKHQTKKDKKIEDLEKQLQDMRNLVNQLIEKGALNKN